MATLDDTEDMEGVDTTKDTEPVWEHSYGYWPYISLKNLFSRGLTPKRILFNKRTKTNKSISKTYMSRTGKRDAGSLAGGSSQMKTSRIGREDGEKRFMIRMGKRKGQNKIIKMESNLERMTKRDGLWGRVL